MSTGGLSGRVGNVDFHPRSSSAEREGSYWLKSRKKHRLPTSPIVSPIEHIVLQDSSLFSEEKKAEPRVEEENE